MASKGPKKKTSSAKPANSKGSVSGPGHDLSTSSSKDPSTRTTPSSKGSSTGPPPTLKGPPTRSTPISNGPSTRSRKVIGTVPSTVTGTAPVTVKLKNQALEKNKTVKSTLAVKPSSTAIAPGTRGNKSQTTDPPENTENYGSWYSTGVEVPEQSEKKSKTQKRKSGISYQPYLPSLCTHLSFFFNSISGGPSLTGKAKKAKITVPEIGIDLFL